MTAEELIAEGRKLQRACSFLRPQENGPPAAIWHPRNRDKITATGEHCWLTVDTSRIPNRPPSLRGYVGVFTDEKSFESGRVEVLQNWPERPGVKLYAHAANVLPPIDAVIAYGSEAVGDWLRSLGWSREWGYNGNLQDTAVQEYERIWQQEFPIYFESDIHAILGGWHFPMPDSDWEELCDEQLLIFTLRDSEPWVEVWQTRSGGFKVIQRIT